MYERYKPGLAVRVWRDIVWYTKQAVKARNEFIAGFGFGVLFLLLPIMAGFIIR